jgi:hypothetical protein
MGLDMFSKRVKIEGAIDDLSFDSTQVVDDDFFYWRKNRHLHNWMSNLYLDKGGNEEFNCVPVRVLDEDLTQLAKDIELKNMDGSSGFFFGDGDYDEDRIEEDLSYVKLAKQAIAEGDAIYYMAWY